MVLRSLVFILFGAGFVSYAAAQNFASSDEAIKYRSCINKVNEDSNVALITAREWYLDGGGVAAQHCEGLALNELGHHSDAASVFEMAASKLSLSDGLDTFAQRNKGVLSLQLNYLAGMAWKAAGELDKSYNALSLSLASLKADSPYAYDVYIERGIVQFALEDYRNAAIDFTQALDINPEKIDAFLYRAQSYRKNKEHLKARLDLNAALSIAPNQPELLFESGINYRMQKNDEKALVEWERLIEKYPGTSWEKLARDNIDLIGK